MLSFYLEHLLFTNNIIINPVMKATLIRFYQRQFWKASTLKESSTDLNKINNPCPALTTSNDKNYYSQDITSATAVDHFPQRLHLSLPSAETSFTVHST